MDLITGSFCETVGCMPKKMGETAKGEKEILVAGHVSLESRFQVFAGLTLLNLINPISSFP